MFRVLFLFISFLSVVFGNGQTCDDDAILGVFPEIDGVSCDSYALMIGFAAGLGAYLFWENVTK